MNTWEEPLPEWADKKLDGELVVGAQLATKDGRKCGNAVIAEIIEINNPAIAFDHYFKVITDAGNQISLIESEIHELFHPPRYRMISLVPEVIATDLGLQEGGRAVGKGSPILVTRPQGLSDMMWKYFSGNLVTLINSAKNKVSYMENNS